ncbi:hypothetical protein CROQUDRAFT_721334 [Cronartium quercuum f. sp. fusiforme G11]|uniref:Uncharacterized protein n=1 Tax=Cronartium quercuum f. sp. fusiforme G11 TaxID=708437 RepID=A0A9P6NN42_9BASI|nr:hypothetical protein CROQUDRAFT_721334 [Cronartium quercuum f. sp. fusiforme G11]
MRHYTNLFLGSTRISYHHRPFLPLRRIRFLLSFGPYDIRRHVTPPESSPDTSKVLPDTTKAPVCFVLVSFAFSFWLS